jgi:predicted metallopeptidase
MKVRFDLAPDIKVRLREILDRISLGHIRADNIVAFRSYGSVSRAYARIWSLPTIWQTALKVQPHYCIEVIHERFDREKPEQQTRILIHELLHIPKTFSGALLPHTGRGRVRVDSRTVNRYYQVYLNNPK